MTRLGAALREVVSASGLSLTNAFSYDTAGRMLTETNHPGLVTSHAYSSDGRTETIALPGGATRVISNYLDGRLKSVTGSAQVNEFHDYSLTSWSDDAQFLFLSPKNIQRVNYRAVDSLRWIERVTDKRGYPSQERRPSFYSNGTNVVTLTNTTYYEWGHVKAEERPGLDHLLLSIAYESDGYGQQTLQRLTTNNWATVPYLASADRINESEVVYETDGLDWFLVSTNRTYLGDGSDSPTAISVSKERLTGFAAGNIQSELREYDFNNNLTTTTTYIDLTNKQVTVVIDTPESSLGATNITINGLLEASSTPTVAARTQFRYDTLGRQTQVINSLGFAASTGYSPTTGQLISSADFTGSVTTFEYHPSTHLNAGRLKTQTAANGKKTYFEYNGRGELIRTWGDVPYPEERLYNDYGELTTLRTFRGGTGWNGSNWPTSPGTADETRWFYQERTGLLTNKTDALGRFVSYTYHTNNLLKTRAWARGTVTTNTYNAFLDLECLSYSDGTLPVVFTNYNRLGLPRNITDAAGQRVLAYDALGRLLSDSGTSGTFGGITLSNHFHVVLGRDYLKSTGLPANFQHDYAYDTNGRLASAAYGVYSALYGYVPNSDLLQTTSSRNNGVTKMTATRSWEFGQRLQGIANAAGATTVSSHAYAYDAVNRRIRATLADSSAWFYDYNDRNELVVGKRVWADQSPVAGQQFEYAYDNIGNRTSAKEGGDPNGASLRLATYTANALNQYTTHGVPGALDVCGVSYATASVTVNSQSTTRKTEYYHRELAVSNGSGPVYPSVTVTATQDGNSSNIVGNALVSSSAPALTYDHDGNLTQDGLWMYTWDAENRLKQIESLSAVPAAGKRKLEFAYDYSGRRVTKKSYTWNGSWQLAADLKFLYDGWNLLAELNATNNALIRSYLWGQDLSGTMNRAGGVGGLLLMTDHSGSSHHFAAYDGNGNVMALVNALDQAVSALYEYAPFGVIVRSTGLFAKTNQLRWSTKFWDDETALVYYGYRYYQPTIGRWISRDPLGETEGIHLYAALLNSPVDQIDPDGESILKKEKLAAIFAALATLYNSSVKGGPSRGPMQEWARRLQIEALANSEGARRNRAARASGGGVGGPPKNFYRATGAVWGIALVALEATYNAVAAAANVALGMRSEEGSAGYALEAALMNYAKGETDLGDLDAVEAALLMSGGVAADAFTALLAFEDAGTLFQPDE